MNVRDRVVGAMVCVFALLPAFWLLTHPTPPEWLIFLARPPAAPGYIASSSWPVIAWCLLPSVLAWRDWRWRQGVTFGWIAILFCAWQAYCFNTAVHPAGSPFVIWGLLPGSDSQTYFNNAVEIAEGTGIRIAWGARQMWPGFLAVLYSWCSGNLKLILSLLALMQAAVTCIAWEMVYRMLGRLAAFIWLCSVAFFCRSFVIGLFMTEQLGLLLGMLAAVALLYGWKQRRFIPWLTGLALLSFGLSARPGCDFVLATLLLGTFWRFREAIPVGKAKCGWLFDLAWRRSLAAAGVVGICCLCNTVSFFHLVNPPRVPSNYWLVLYGITKGGTWAQSLHDLGPSVASDKIIPTYDENADRVFFFEVKKAVIKQIRHEPISLLYGARRAWLYVVRQPTFFYRWSAGWWGYCLLAASFLMLLLGFKRGARDDAIFYWLVWGGVFLSLPFVPPWDSGDRTYAATDPLLWLTPAAFISFCWRALAGQKANEPEAIVAGIPPPRSNNIGTSFRVVAITGALLVIASLVLPSILLELNRQKTMPRYSDLVSLEKASSNISQIPSRLVGINRGVIVGARGTRTFLPYVAREDFDRGTPGGRQYPIGEFMKELPSNSFVALLERPRYLCCALSSVPAQLEASAIPLQDTGWMSYKYILTLATSLELTEKQVMILCPSTASHEIFWKAASRRAQ